jgi:hypothetical protein
MKNCYKFTGFLVDNATSEILRISRPATSLSSESAKLIPDRGNPWFPLLPFGEF